MLKLVSKWPMANCWLFPALCEELYYCIHLYSYLYPHSYIVMTMQHNKQGSRNHGGKGANDELAHTSDMTHKEM